MIGISASARRARWTIMATRASSKLRLAQQQDLAPAALSSAGVPSTVTRSSASSATPARARPAPAAMAAITLCPQAPTPGRASYSAHDHVQRPRPGPGRECRRQVADPALDLQAGPVQQLAQPGAGPLPRTRVGVGGCGG